MECINNPLLNNSFEHSSVIFEQANSHIHNKSDNEQNQLNVHSMIIYYPLIDWMNRNRYYFYLCTVHTYVCLQNIYVVYVHTHIQFARSEGKNPILLLIDKSYFLKLWALERNEFNKISLLITWKICKNRPQN